MAKRNEVHLTVTMLDDIPRMVESLRQAPVNSFEIGFGDVPDPYQSNVPKEVPRSQGPP